MTYQHERDEFISLATSEGLSLDTCRKLLRHATTLQRLAEAQCNGDWPYNGDRDRPLGFESKERERHDTRYTVCPKCEASGIAKSAMRWSATTTEYMRVMAAHAKECGPDSQCAKSIDANGPHAEYARNSVKDLHGKICPDCRTQELVITLLATESGIRGRMVELANVPQVKAIFQGDPRGAVLLLTTPSYPWSDDGSKGRGLYVPARYKS